MDYSEVLSDLVKYYTKKEIIYVIVEQMTNQIDRIKKFEDFKKRLWLINYIILKKK